MKVSHLDITQKSRFKQFLVFSFFFLDLPLFIYGTCMQWILHDRSDEHCLKLLTNCFEALPDNEKVIIVESILHMAPENTVSTNIPFEQDLLIMLAQNPGGKERTQKEYETLAIKSGFSCCKVICSVYNSWVMEFHKTAHPQLSPQLFRVVRLFFCLFGLFLPRECAGSNLMFNISCLKIKSLN